LALFQRLDAVQKKTRGLRYFWANSLPMRKLLPLLLVFFGSKALAQNCNSVRYLDEVFSEVTVTSGIKFGEADPYGIIGSQDLLLDLYMPTGDVLQKRPLIIYAFGGGFLIGTRFQPPIPEYCQRWARMGYVVAAIDYRIGFNTTSSGSAERAVYRGVQDVRAAMRFLGQFSAGYGIDTTTIFLTGSSAGCFSALHSTFMEETDRPQSSYGIFLEPGDMGCADCSGNTYLNGRELRPKGIINHWGAILDTAYHRAYG
jgi:acetyl esterase/lipase